MKLPRGLRNNNPLNIRIGNDWRWERIPNTDGVFEQFTEMKYGYRAAFIILKRYINKYQRNTIAKIIESWAPSNENNTAQYIATVSTLTGIRPYDVLDFNDSIDMCRIVHAMAYVENGQEVDKSEILEGYDLV